MYKNLNIMEDMRYYIITGIMILIICFFIPLVKADSTIKTCLDSDTLEVNTTITVYENDVPKEIKVNENVFCEYGCLNNDCNSGSILNKFTFPIFFFIALIFSGIGIWLNKWFFGFVGGNLFLILGLILIVDGIIIDVVPIQNNFINGMGIIILLVGLYLTLISILGRKSSD